MSSSSDTSRTPRSRGIESAMDALHEEHPRKHRAYPRTPQAKIAWLHEVTKDQKWSKEQIELTLDSLAGLPNSVTLIARWGLENPGWHKAEAITDALGLTRKTFNRATKPLREREIARLHTEPSRAGRFSVWNFQPLKVDLGTGTFCDLGTGTSTTPDLHIPEREETQMSQCQDHEIGAFPQVSPHWDIEKPVASYKREYVSTSSTSPAQEDQETVQPVVVESEPLTHDLSTSGHRQPVVVNEDVLARALSTYGEDKTAYTREELLALALTDAHEALRLVRDGEGASDDQLLDAWVAWFNELVRSQDDGRYVLGREQAPVVKEFLRGELYAYSMSELRDFAAYVVLGDGTEYGPRCKLTGSGATVIKWLHKVRARTRKDNFDTNGERFVAELAWRHLAHFPSFEESPRVITTDPQGLAQEPQRGENPATWEWRTQRTRSIAQRGSQAPMSGQGFYREKIERMQERMWDRDLVDADADDLG